MHYNRTQWDKYSLHRSFNCFWFHTDTYYTQVSRQSNRSSRCTSSERCINKEHGETNTFFTYHSTVSDFIQTLTTLSLSGNDIRDEGVKYVSYALVQNTVRQILLIIHSTFSYFIQTLTTLKLSWNQIQVQGAKYLSDALLQNTVRQILFSFFIQLFVIS